MPDSETHYFASKENGPAFDEGDHVWATIYTGWGRRQASKQVPGVVTKVIPKKHGGYGYMVRYDDGGKENSKEFTAENLSSGNTE